MSNLYSIFKMWGMASVKQYMTVLIVSPLLLFGISACADIEGTWLDSGYPHNQYNERDSRDTMRREPPIRSEYAHIQAAFAPWDDVEGIIVRALDAAQEQIWVQAYVLSNQEVVNALIRARARGLDVQVLVDRTQMHKRASRVPDLARAGIPVRLETRYKSAHNKLIIIDAANSLRATLITGSMNYSDTSPQANAENILIIRHFYNLVQDYASNWRRHAEKATPYTMPNQGPVQNPVISIPIPIIVPTPIPMPVPAPAAPQSAQRWPTTGPVSNPSNGTMPGWLRGS